MLNLDANIQPELLVRWHAFVLLPDRGELNLDEVNVVLSSGAVRADHRVRAVAVDGRTLLFSAPDCSLQEVVSHALRVFTPVPHSDGSALLAHCNAVAHQTPLLLATEDAVSGELDLLGAPLRRTRDSLHCMA